MLTMSRSWSQDWSGAINRKQPLLQSGEGLVVHTFGHSQLGIWLGALLLDSSSVSQEWQGATTSLPWENLPSDQQRQPMCS